MFMLYFTSIDQLAFAGFCQIHRPTESSKNALDHVEGQLHDR